jgi:hypothetical protein
MCEMAPRTVQIANYMTCKEDEGDKQSRQQIAVYMCEEDGANEGLVGTTFAKAGVIGGLNGNCGIAGPEPLDPSHHLP